MTQKKIEARLIQADKRVVIGEKRLDRQREFLLGLERLGNNTSAARALLEELEKIQAIRIEHRDALSRELNTL